MSDEMDEIWALYADDGAQSLDAMEEALFALGSGGAADAAAHIGALFRAVHTFKGNSRVLGLAVVESRAHLSEDLIGLVRDQGVPWDAEIKDILLLAADTLRGMLEQTAATRADVDPTSSEGLMAQLVDKIARCSGAPAAAPELVPAPAPAVADPRPEPVAVSDAAPVVEPEPQPEPTPAQKKTKPRKDATPETKTEPQTEHSPPAAEPAEPARPRGPEKRLADDPTYREIFRGMSVDATTKLAGMLDSFATDSTAAHRTARREADGLAHAARQMGLDDWVEALDIYLKDEEIGSEPLARLLLSLSDLSEKTFGASLPTVTTPAPDAPGFFDVIRDPLAAIASFGTGFFCGDSPDPDALRARVDIIQSTARSAGYVRVLEAAGRILVATNAQDFHAAELRLYEELAGVEAVMPDAARASGISPRDMLQTWCAEHIFSTLSELEATLERLKYVEDLDPEYLRLDRLMRLVHHACGHHRIETAGQLAMSLIDLFSRLHAAGSNPDAILSHVARGFIDTVEIVFDAITQGQTPDTASLDKLFEEASNICFVQDGVMTASAIERRLGLPKEFHRVFSPESVRAASEAIEQGLRFFILRADINSDEQLAEAFIEWLSSGASRSITNVTVFSGEETLFDFLLATTLDEASMVEALAAIDPTAKKLRLIRALVMTEGETSLPSQQPLDPDQGQVGPPQASVTAEMVEAIGEIAASQSMISHMLSDLAENDLFDAVDAILRANGQDWRRAKTQVRHLLTTCTGRLQEIAQAETQLVGQITQLQEETVEIRSRRIETIFRPLEAFVQTYSRRNRREAQTSFAGGDITLDVTILENLRKVLRNLAVARLELGTGAPRSMHMSFHRDEERVLVIFEDDGSAAETSPALDEVRASVSRMGGTLRDVALPGAGIRFHISLPLAMVVLEGMVVGVNGVRYVVPIDAIRMILQPESDRKFRVSAAEGREMLRIAENEIVAVHSLPGGVTTFSQSTTTQDGPRRSVYVVLGAQGRSVAIPVDELIGQQLVLLRPLKGVLSRMQNMTGIALLAGGDVGMVVSANMLCAAQQNPGNSPSLRM